MLCSNDLSYLILLFVETSITPNIKFNINTYIMKTLPIIITVINPNKYLYNVFKCHFSSICVCILKTVLDSIEL